VLVAVVDVELLGVVVLVVAEVSLSLVALVSLPLVALDAEEDSVDVLDVDRALERVDTLVLDPPVAPPLLLVLPLGPVLPALGDAVEVLPIEEGRLEVVPVGVDVAVACVVATLVLPPVDPLDAGAAPQAPVVWYVTSSLAHVGSSPAAAMVAQMALPLGCICVQHTASPSHAAPPMLASGVALVPDELQATTAYRTPSPMPTRTLLLMCSPHGWDSTRDPSRASLE
jgi:hypothetical protein